MRGGAGDDAMIMIEHLVREGCEQYDKTGSVGWVAFSFVVSPSYTLSYFEA